MSATSRFSSKQLRLLVWCEWTSWPGSGVAAPDNQSEQPLLCEHCGAPLRLAVTVDSVGGVLVNHGLKYLDSG